MVRTVVFGVFVALVVLVSHPLVALIPGLPSLRGENQDNFLFALWQVVGAVMGAALVALFFLLQAVQASRPSLVVLQELLKRLRISLWLGILAGITIGIGESHVIMNGASFLSPQDFPSRSFLPILDGALLVFGLLVTLWLVAYAARLLHSNQLLSIAEGIAKKRASRLHSHEVALSRLQHLETRARIGRVLDKPLVDFDVLGRKVQWRKPDISILRCLRIPWERRMIRRNRDFLKSLFGEMKEQAFNGVSSDQLDALQGFLEVQIRALEAASRSSGRSRREPSLKDRSSPDFGANWTRDITEGNHQELLSVALHRNARRGTDILIWWPIRVWRLGLEEKDADLSGLGLHVLGRTSLKVSRMGDDESRRTLVYYWREHPLGPEGFVHQEASRAVANPNVPRDDEAILVLQSVEVQEMLLATAAAALALRDYELAGQLAASVFTVQNVFHMVESRGSSSPELRRCVDLYNTLRLQGLILLTGMVAVEFSDGRSESEHLLRRMTELLCDKWSLQEIVSASTITHRTTPNWFHEYSYLSDESPDDLRFDMTRPEELQGITILLCRTYFAAKSSNFTSGIPITTSWKPNRLELQAASLVANIAGKWNGLISDQILLTLLNRAHEQGRLPMRRSTALWLKGAAFLRRLVFQDDPNIDAAKVE